MENQNSLLLERLWREAREARSNAHAPYSGFFVGAAVLTLEDKIFSGCNVENASYGGTVCAERIALFKAVSEGFKKFKAIAVVSDAKGVAVPPCGFCLQVISEFCDPDVKIILATPKRVEREYTLAELLPAVFTKEFL